MNWKSLVVILPLLTCQLAVSPLDAKKGPGPRTKSVSQNLQDLKFGTPEVREAALDALLGGRDKRVAPALLEVLLDSSGTFRLKVIEGLGRLHEKAAVDPLVAILKEPGPEDKVQAVISLGEIGEPGAGPALLEALKDTQTDVVTQAVIALGKCRFALAGPGLRSLLQKKNPLLRQAAVDALGMIGDASALEDLKKQLMETDTSYRRHVIRAIGGLKDPSVTKLLGMWLAESDPYLRAFSAEALGLRGESADLVPALVRALEDEVPAVRIRALETLGTWKSRAAVTPIKKVLRDPNEILRWKAASALGAIGDPSALDALKYVAENDENNEVRHVAAEALDRIAKK